ncbi:unnamed protein product [Lactuca saligna]|uniref:Uncharacterized protein n=1 Tax=Lactuca saligna TaxID=75948 RepID=A0AA35Y046_LACSI|nr:unnamed protein product [Lactuca saligna]
MFWIINFTKCNFLSYNAQHLVIWLSLLKEINPSTARWTIINPQGTTLEVEKDLYLRRIAAGKVGGPHWKDIDLNCLGIHRAVWESKKLFVSLHNCLGICRSVFQSAELVVIPQNCFSFCRVVCQSAELFLIPQSCLSVLKVVSQCSDIVRSSISMDDKRGDGPNTMLDERLRGCNTNSCPSLPCRPYYYADDEELLQFVKEYYMMERDGSEFEYEDVWNAVKKTSISCRR